MSKENHFEKKHHSQEPESEQTNPSKSAAGGSKWEKIMAESTEDTIEEEVSMKTTQAAQTQQDDSPQEFAAGLEFPARHVLEDQLTAMEMKCEEYKTQMMRAQAELANVQRRSQRDLDSAYKYNNEKLIMALLPVLDSLTRALETPVDVASSQLAAVQQGVRLTCDLLIKTLAQFGVNPIDPAQGDVFNPEQHEAVSTQAHPEVEVHCIINVLQKGYRLHDRILRAAMVVVSAG